MNYDWLFSFVVFADYLNFTRAAEALHITQPALHAQIRKLSEEVGATLYRRDGRALVLSAEGRRLAAFGREVQARGGDVLAELRGEDSRGPVVLASGQGAFLYLLGSAIRRFPKHRWPLRAVSMTGPDATRAVREARADVGVAVLSSTPTDLDCHMLRRVGQVVLLPQGHRLSKRRKVMPADLDSESIVVAPEGSPHRMMLSQALSAAGAIWSVAVEATGWELMVQFARYGLGIAVVNDFCPVPRGLVGVRLEGVPDVEYHVVTRPKAPRESRDTLVRLIQESAGS
ncbi:MAG TPA: LysR family transcriptional regulator [Polyangiaceae bacterium]|nr:LysR family transcriptional regulator [Polyangiaceae bacterium]